jgi:hypothetical protein
VNVVDRPLYVRVLSSSDLAARDSLLVVCGMLATRVGGCCSSSAWPLPLLLPLVVMVMSVIVLVCFYFCFCCC